MGRFMNTMCHVCRHSLNEFTHRSFPLRRNNGLGFNIAQAAVTVHQQGQLPFERGQSLSLSFDRSRMHVFDAAGKALANGLTG